MSALALVTDETPALSLELPEDLTFEDWERTGGEIASASKRLNWWIGDWWNAGIKFGEERRSATAHRLFGIEYQTVRNIGWVSGQFLSRRRDTLSFKHHAEVAALSSIEADRLLDKAEAQNLSTRDLRREILLLRATKGEFAPPSRDDDSSQLQAICQTWNRAQYGPRREFLTLLEVGGAIQITSEDAERTVLEP